VWHFDLLEDDEDECELLDELEDELDDDDEELLALELEAPVAEDELDELCEPRSE
jgi:hypothetical protein